MSYAICLYEKFYLDLINLPKKIQKDIVKKASPELRENPYYGAKIKKLKGYDNLWRHKPHPHYRLIYTIENKNVIFIKAVTRQDDYRHVSYNPAKEPSIKAVDEIPEIRASKFITDEYVEASNQAGNTRADRNDALDYMQIDIQKLLESSIPDEYYHILEKCASGSDVIQSDIPDQIKERALHIINPPTIAEIKSSPQRVLEDDNDLLWLAEGKITIESLMLQLDEEQEAFLERYRDNPESGPWLVQGGPGSGKSTIAIHCIKELIDSPQKSISSYKGNNKQILFTTFTHALKNTNSYLLSELTRRNNHEVNFSVLHYLAIKILNDAGVEVSIAKESEKQKIYHEIVDSKIDSDPYLGIFSENGFSFLDMDFIDDEIEWVIYGNGIETYDQYLESMRHGRERNLNSSQWIRLWHFFELYDQALVERGKTTWNKVFVEALKCISSEKGRYDYVFIEEAQDLPAVAIQFAMKLCKNPKNLFITVDINQSIYGSGIPWKSIAPEMKLQCRTAYLSKNYRLPKEIMIAATDLVKDLPFSDLENLANTCLYSGYRPQIAVCDDLEEELIKITEFVNNSLLELRLAYDSVAILCQTRDLAEEISRKLPLEFNAKHLKNKSSITAHKGVKVLTIHSAKGLQFPVVIIPRLTESLAGGNFICVDRNELHQKQRRLLFVACTRAMRKLLVTTIYGQESAYIHFFSKKYWEYSKPPSDYQTRNLI